MKATVSVLRCNSYDPSSLDRILAQGAEAAAMPDVRGARILVKPNILTGVDSSRAVTTHPAFVAAVVRLLKKKGASSILAGDSPAWQSGTQVGKKCGIKDAVEAEGGIWADFSAGREAPCPQGKLVSTFTIAEPFFDADLLFDLPKLKTHMLTKYTGAIKNLFGLVPGFAKSAWHMRFPGKNEFGTMLVDLAALAAPDFTFMDAVIGMEGAGPNNGNPKKLDLVLASRDPLALDMTAARIIGYDPASIAHLSDAATRGIWISGEKDIVILGEQIEAVRPESFNLVRQAREGTPFSKVLPPSMHRFIRDLTVKRPAFDLDRCRLCGACIAICPAKALALKPREGTEGTRDRKMVGIDYERCIRCYCCHEVCPHDAIGLVTWPRGIHGVTRVRGEGERS